MRWVTVANGERAEGLRVSVGVSMWTSMRPPSSLFRAFFLGPGIGTVGGSRPGRREVATRPMSGFLHRVPDPRQDRLRRIKL